MTRLPEVFRVPAGRLGVICAVLALAVAGPLAAGPALASSAAAAGGAGTGGSGDGGQAGAAVRATDLDTVPSQQVTIAITAISPQIATPRKPVTVSGVVINGTKGPVSGLGVQLFSSARPLVNRDELASYAAGQLPLDSPLPRLVPLVGVLGAGASRSWKLTAPAATLGLTSFGVYPLAAQVSQSGVPLNAEHTFLPFWPGGQKSARLARRERVAWVWPLTAPPEQAACPALLNNDLAHSFTATGRLGSLLAAGAGPAGAAADLTWAIDPSLLASAGTMSKPYQVGGTASCAGAQRERASPAARAWLDQLRSLTASQDFFVTPYADVDVAALTHAGLSTNLSRAYAIGRRVAKAAGLAAAQRADGVPGQIAWPADGIADYAVLGNLAVHGVGTVILSSRLMPPSRAVRYTPSAITTTPDGVNAGLHIALADSTLTQVLSAGPATAGQPGDAPAAAGVAATVQRFLAESAMIAAEEPSVPRSLVIAPPRQWDPMPGLASALLAATDQAPWLRPESLAGLFAARSHPGRVARQAPPVKLVSHQELRRRLLHKVKALESVIKMQASMLGRGAGYLAPAVAAIESSAWRGHPARARSLLARVSSYLTAQRQKVRIIDAGPVTLTGKSGPVPVSIINRLGQPVTVRLRAQASSNRITVLTPTTTVTIGAHEQRTVAVRVRSSVAGTTTLTLTLLAPDGQPLPGSPAQLTVDATHFGTTALVIIAIALGVFLITSIARTIRRGRRDSGPAHPDDPAGPPDPPGQVVDERSPGGQVPGGQLPGKQDPNGQVTGAQVPGGRPLNGHETARERDYPGSGPQSRPTPADRPPHPAWPGAKGADSGGSPGEPDSVVMERMSDHETAEEPDEYASAPGRVERPR